MQFEIITEIPNQHHDIANTLIQMMSKYQITQDLVNEVYLILPYKPILLSIIPELDTSVFPLHIGGTCIPKSKTIRIRFKNNDHLIWRMFSTLIFELLNLRNLSFQQIENILHNSLDANQYALAMEKLEAQTVIDHHEMAKLGISLYNWNAIVNKFKDVNKTLALQDIGGHTEFYRHQYSLCKNNLKPF